MQLQNSSKTESLSMRDWSSIILEQGGTLKKHYIHTIQVSSMRSSLKHQSLHVLYIISSKVLSHLWCINFAVPVEHFFPHTVLYLKHMCQSIYQSILYLF